MAGFNSNHLIFYYQKKNSDIEDVVFYIFFKNKKMTNPYHFLKKN